MLHRSVLLSNALFVGTVLCLLVGSASAQPSFVISTGAVSYPGDGQFEVTNVGTDTLLLSFPSTEDLGGDESLYGTVGGYGWYFDAETSDSLYESIYLPFGIDPLPEIVVAPDAIAEFRIQGFDPCPVCRPGGLPSDTLYLRAADESGADTVRVVLDLSGYVATESPPEDREHTLAIYPNPAWNTVTLTFRTSAPSPLSVTVFDVLGRAVLTFPVPSTTSIALDTEELPQGLYFVRADLPNGRFLSQRFTVLR